MKQIKVNNNCDGCGLCIVNSMYLEENDEGYAQPIVGKAIKDSDMEKLKEVVNNCPQKALLIVETGKATVSGKAGIKQIIENLKKHCNSLNVKRIADSDVKFNINDYHISTPYSFKGFENYSSESSARSAAKDEFNRLCYSEYAYNPILKRIFVEYKVNILKPYYNNEDVPESVYYKYNEIVRKQLADVYAEVSELIGEGKLSKSWKEFSVYLKSKDMEIEFLKKFDERSTCSGIIAELKSLSGTSLNNYVDEMDFDYNEEYAGEGLFGRTKYKKVWHFQNFNEAAESFIKDLKWAIDFKSDEITERAVDLVNFALDTFEKEFKKAYMKKIEELEKLVQSL